MEEEYQFGEKIKSSEVPNWARQPIKWEKIVEKIVNLEIGTSLPINFPNGKLAKTVRNTIRDRCNLRMRTASIRTRLVQNDDGTAVVYFTRVQPTE